MCVRLIRFVDYPTVDKIYSCGLQPSYLYAVWFSAPRRGVRGSTARKPTRKTRRFVENGPLWPWASSRIVRGMPRSFSECASEMKANRGGGSRDLRVRMRWNPEARNTPPIIMSRLSLIVTIVMHFSKKMPGKNQYRPGHVHRDALIPNALSYVQGGGVSKFPHGRRTLVKLNWCGAKFYALFKVSS